MIPSVPELCLSRYVLFQYKSEGRTIPRLRCPAKVDFSIILYPARYDSVIAVGATDQSNNRAYFSNFGSALDIVAPGVSILSTLPGDRYGTMSGTSMATPHVSGTAALILENNPSLSVEQVRARLYSTADDLGTRGLDRYYGWGLVDAEESVTTT